MFNSEIMKYYCGKMEKYVMTSRNPNSSMAQTELFYNAIKRSERECPGEHGPDFYLYLACVTIPTSFFMFWGWGQWGHLFKSSEVFCFDPLLITWWTHTLSDHLSPECSVLDRNVPTLMNPITFQDFLKSLSIDFPKRGHGMLQGSLNQGFA